MKRRNDKAESSHKGKKNSSLMPRASVGPRIVYAWFQTVINPLLVALRREQVFLEHKNWTWVFRPGDLEFMTPVREFVPILALDNFEQFLDLNADLKVSCEDHDRAVATLLVQCRLLQPRVEETPGLREIYERLTSPTVLSQIGVNVQDVFGAYPPNDHLALLAQYIVNHTGALPDYYRTASLWNPNRDELLALLSEEPVARTEEETVMAGESLLIVTRRLINLLQKKREHLSLQYDVPYVAAQDVSMWEARQ